MNFRPNTLWINDNLPVLRGMDSGTVDLVYLDPPFNSKKEYKAPIGTPAEGQRFDDTWRWDDLDVRWLGEIDRRNAALSAVVNAARLTQGKGTAAYLAFMGVRLLELRRVLKDTGSLWLHCDPTASHYLKLALDAVFGKDGCRNEVVWCYTGPGSPKMRQFNRKHDIVHWYAKGRTWTFNADAVRVPHKALNTNTKGAAIAAPLTAKERDAYLRRGKVPETWWTRFSPVGRIASERTGWATQKPLKLLQRIIKASSNKGDLVLDPFAGCATCCVAAAMEGRDWVAIEACEAASDIVQVRLSEAAGGELAAASDHYKAKILRRAPRRTDLNGDEPRPGSRPYRTRDNMDFLYGVQQGRCAGCKNHYRAKDFAIDHVVPRADGGSNDLDNLQLLCFHCNAVKGTGTMHDLRHRLAKQEDGFKETLGW